MCRNFFLKPSSNCILHNKQFQTKWSASHQFDTYSVDNLFLVVFYALQQIEHFNISNMLILDRKPRAYSLAFDVTPTYLNNELSTESRSSCDSGWKTDTPTCHKVWYLCTTQLYLGISFIFDSNNLKKKKDEFYSLYLQKEIYHWPLIL